MKSTEWVVLLMLKHMHLWYLLYFRFVLNLVGKVTKLAASFIEAAVRLCCLLSRYRYDSSMICMCHLVFDTWVSSFVSSALYLQSTFFSSCLVFVLEVLGKVTKYTFFHVKFYKYRLVYFLILSTSQYLKAVSYQQPLKNLLFYAILFYVKWTNFAVLIIFLFLKVHSWRAVGPYSIVLWW